MGVIMPDRRGAASAGPEGYASIRDENIPPLYVCCEEGIQGILEVVAGLSLIKARFMRLNGHLMKIVPLKGNASLFEDFLYRRSKVLQNHGSRKLVRGWV